MGSAYLIRFAHQSFFFANYSYIQNWEGGEEKSPNTQRRPCSYLKIGMTKTFPYVV